MPMLVIIEVLYKKLKFHVHPPIGSRVCSEMEDPRKWLRLHLSKCDGKFSKKMPSEEVRVASISMRANNDPSEQMFGCFSEANEKGGGMGLNESAGLGHVLV